MAEIVRARDTHDGDRVVAIKRILPHLCADEHYRAMFLDESRVLTQLHHPSIVRTLEVGEIDGVPYIALEYIRGQDARELFAACEREGQPLPLGLACYVIARVCEGLQYVHDRLDDSGVSLDIIHRDVSLQNLLIGYDGEVKLTDFGIAVSGLNEVRTEAGIVKGKFGYMSPEQIRGTKLDRRSDVFATGICLYELLTGERLFSGENDYKAVERVRQADVPRPSTRNRQIPSRLEQVVMKALAKNPRDRYASANDMRRALQAFLSEANLFIERTDLGQYLRALFEDHYQQLQRSEAAERALWASQNHNGSVRLPEGEPFDPSEPTVVGAGAAGPVEPRTGQSELIEAQPELIEESTGLKAFDTVSPLAVHSVVPEAGGPDSPPPDAPSAPDAPDAPDASQDEQDEPDIATRPRAGEPVPEGPSQFDMDWDEQEPTTISQGFKHALPMPTAFRSAPPPAHRSPSRQALASDDHAVAADKPSLAELRQRSLPTLEIHRPRETRAVAIALASASAALAVFLIVYFLRGRAEAGVRIDTEPKDAIVHIDGRRVPGEQSPFIVTHLSSGVRHTVVVERGGHTSWSTTLKLPAGEIFSLPTVRLTPIAAPAAAPAVEVEIEPEPAVEVEPSPPAKPSRPAPSRAKRTDSAASARRAARSASVPSSSSSSSSPSPSPKAPASAARSGQAESAATSGSGTLRINTRPWSQVRVDGVKVGTTPLMGLEISAGTHKLTLENPEFGIKQQLSVTVRPGETVTRVLTLKP